MPKRDSISRRLPRHHNRQDKLKKTNLTPVTIADRNEVDVSIIDLVLKSLYYNSHIDVLNVDEDIYKKAGVKIPFMESERLWEVMISSGLVNPVAGFGNAGKLKLSRTGYQLMAQFGGYREYMDSLKKSQEQTQIVLEMPEEKMPDSDCKELTDKKGRSKH